jgi:hypothetical protein
MAVGIYTLPICDGCKLPWLPVGWTQDSDPRNLREGTKPLRCGKCKSIGWDREFVKQQKAEATETAVSPFDSTKTIEMPRNVALNEALDHEDGRKITTIHADPSTGIPTMIETVEEMSIEEAKRRYPGAKISRCKHRMTDCPICHPKEAA